MIRTKKFASKQTFRGKKYVRVNKDTSVSEKRQPLSDQSGTSICVKHNLTASKKEIYDTSVNAENKVGENNFCKSESNFARDGNTVVSINLLCAFVQKNNYCILCGDNISFFKIHQSGEVLSAI
jgi:hypothetical protein